MLRDSVGGWGGGLIGRAPEMGGGYGWLLIVLLREREVCSVNGLGYAWDWEVGEVEAASTGEP